MPAAKSKKATKRARSSERVTATDGSYNVAQLTEPNFTRRYAIEGKGVTVAMEEGALHCANGGKLTAHACRVCRTLAKTNHDVDDHAQPDNTRVWVEIQAAADAGAGTALSVVGYVSAARLTLVA